jgi:hypothetical protein
MDMDGNGGQPTMKVGMVEECNAREKKEHRLAK